MREFLYSDAHLTAIKAFPEIAIGKTFSYNTKTIPSGSDVHVLLRDHGENYNVIN